MSEDNNPKGTVEDVQPSYDESVDAIADLLEDSDLPNTGDEGEAQEAETETEAEDETDEVEAEADDEEEATEDEEQAEGEDEDESPESSAGRFVAHDAKVRLPDGTVTTVGELAKSPLLHSDYTRKTQEVAEERKSIDKAKEDLTGYAQNLRQERDFLLQVAQQFIPQPPDPSMIDEDFFAYQHAKEKYERDMQAVQQLRHFATQDQQRQQYETQAQMQQRLAKEAEILAQEMPELRQPEGYRKFWNDTVDTMAAYGFTQDELETAVDHRFFRVFKDLMRYHKARKAAPKVKEQVKGKPVMKPGKRMDPKKKTTREADLRRERLRKTGDFDAGVASIMDLDID